MTVESEVTRKIAQEVIKKLDIVKIADRIAPKVAEAITKSVVDTVLNSWEFTELIAESIDYNKKLQKILSEKIANALSK